MFDAAQFIDIDLSLKAVDRQDACGATKVTEDLLRYEAVIEATRPEVVVECGTWADYSAVWFAQHGLAVISIDILAQSRPPGYEQSITWLTGDSGSNDVAAHVAALVDGRRTMVVLDSAHTAEHVRKEIVLYGPLVSPGCHLVVEDGIVHWMNETLPLGSPLDAIEGLLVGSDEWARDVAVEAMFPVSMYPAGWWMRRRPHAR